VPLLLSPVCSVLRRRNGSPTSRNNTKRRINSNLSFRVISESRWQNFPILRYPHRRWFFSNFQRDALPVSATLDPLLAPGILDENTTHRIGRPPPPIPPQHRPGADSGRAPPGAVTAPATGSGAVSRLRHRAATAPGAGPGRALPVPAPLLTPGPVPPPTPAPCHPAPCRCRHRAARPPRPAPLCAATACWAGSARTRRDLKGVTFFAPSPILVTSASFSPKNRERKKRPGQPLTSCAAPGVSP
jgi:hypothetical protein